MSSDWEGQGFAAQPGWKLDLRYDYLNQNQLRSGKATISPAAASRIVDDNGENQEVEKFTRNRYYTAAIDYGAADWGVNLQLPYIVRAHSTLGTNSDGITPGAGGGEYDSKTSSLGDAKVIGRYQGFTPRHNLGILLGLKLPTGSHTQTGTSTDAGAPGSAPIDRGLQPGTGTTDAIVGAYYFDAFNKDWDYFGQATYQAALDSKDRYRPGNGLNLNLGLRYLGFATVVPQLQLNARRVARDSGDNADTVSTGGTLVYLSPGLAVPIGKQTSLYGFVQFPVYQNVNGVQLAPKITASVGVLFSF
ncbi:MAG: hypothetical protein PHY45_12375 [Rhodocyclaceae bacterium]|nr:hypothetical protein [Rhodocyclaceae bacterium]